MAGHSGPNIVNNGLVLHLDTFNGESYPGSGTIWYDLSGKGNNCSFITTPTWNSSKYFTFNGTNHYGVISNNTTLDFSSEQTLIIVMRHSYTSGRRNPWNQAYGGYGTWTHENGNYISQFFGDSGVDNIPYIGPGSPSTPRDVWNVMCATRNINQHKWYINGNLNNSTSHSYGVLTTTSANILIGNGYAGLWQGDMAMILAYTRTLSDVEVLQNYNATKSRFGL